MLMLSVILALLLGWCTGGRLSRFEEAYLRLLPLPVLAFACQQAMNALAGRISLPFEAWAWLPLLLSYEQVRPWLVDAGAAPKLLCSRAALPAPQRWTLSRLKM